MPRFRWQIEAKLDSMTLARTLVLSTAVAFAISAPSAGRSGEELFSGFASGWREPWMERAMARRRNSFAVEIDSENLCLRVDSHRSASAFWRRVEIETARAPVLSWRWKISNSLDHIDDERRRDGDDYAARVAVMFDGKPFGRNTPFLMYVWAGQETVGNVYRSPYTDKAFTIVLRSGDLDAGEWLMERRDVSADFERYFGRAAKRITGVALMVDTDNTDSRATTWFDELVVH